MSASLQNGGEAMAMMAVFFWAAAGLAALTVFIHWFLAGAKIVRPILAVEMDPGLKWLAYLMRQLGTVSTFSSRWALRQAPCTRNMQTMPPSRCSWP